MATTILEIPDHMAQKVGSHIKLDDFMKVYFSLRHEQFPEGHIDDIDGLGWTSYPVNMKGKEFLKELQEII